MSVRLSSEGKDRLSRILRAVYARDLETAETLVRYAGDDPIHQGFMDDNDPRLYEAINELGTFIQLGLAIQAMIKDADDNTATSE